jgi:hypothetical protein
MQAKELSADGHKLVASLEAAAVAEKKPGGDLIHVTDVGGRLYFAYEQLRNAAEYSERHLLLRRAIERFLHRNLHLRGTVLGLGRELVNELTQARYLQNDTVAYTTVQYIDAIIERYVKLAAAVSEAHMVPAARLRDWIYQPASVEIEHQLVEHAQTDAFMEFTYQHYRDHLYRGAFDELDDATYEAAVYIAVHRTLFKSDLATIRYYAMVARLGAEGHGSLDYFVHLNQTIDQLYQAALTNRLGRLINRHAAPLRILREVVMATKQPERVLADSSELMARVSSEAGRQYKMMRQRINEGIVRSVVFIFITKVLIGIAIEVPYDLSTAGAIAWLPLTINLVFPPAYMATIGLGVRMPGRRNTEVIQSSLFRILYVTPEPPVSYRVRRRVASPTLTAVFNVVYAITFLVSFSILIYILQRIGYNPVNGTIFFIFLSAVSFFGFRLLESARELEVVESRKSLFSVLFDFFYTPFIRVGQWLSDKYSRLNLVTFFLDLAIELPLKSSLRILQQWVGFIRDKQEEI